MVVVRATPSWFDKLTMRATGLSKALILSLSKDEGHAYGPRYITRIGEPEGTR